MQTIMDAASHIAEEIERTRLHLANLEQALEGLKPLMTIDVSMTTLSYSEIEEALPVEDAFIVNAAKAKSKATKASKPPKVRVEKSVVAARSKVGITKQEVSPKPKIRASAKKPSVDKLVAKAEPQVKTKVQVTGKPKTVSAGDKSSGIPATGAAFWMKCVGRKAFSSSELTDAALKKLSLDASAKNVIANRARAWITGTLKQGVLLTAGTRNGINLYKLA